MATDTVSSRQNVAIKMRNRNFISSFRRHYPDQVQMGRLEHQASQPRCFAAPLECGTKDAYPREGAGLHPAFLCRLSASANELSSPDLQRTHSSRTPREFRN